MRYPASEKLEIIRLVEQSHLPVRHTLAKLSIPRATFYRWYDLYQTGGPEALDDRSPRPGRVWNRIPDAVRERIRMLALDEPTLSARELASVGCSPSCGLSSATRECCERSRACRSSVQSAAFSSTRKSSRSGVLRW